MQRLSLPNPALSLSSHPSQPLFAVGTTTTHHLARIQQQNQPKIVTSHALHSILATAFFNDSTLATSGNSIHTFTNDNEGPVYRVPINGEDPFIGTIVQYDPSSFLVGDSDGGVHYIDTRCKAVVSILEQADYITALKPITHLSTETILSASGDGTLCAYDLRQLPTPKIKLMYATDTYNDDLLSLETLQGLAVAGTLSGAINVYDLRFLDPVHDHDTRIDRFYGHPECVNDILRWDDVVITASGDGYIRVVDVVNKKLLGMLEYDMEGVDGKRKNDDTWPVEGMVRLSALETPIFALRGHDHVIRFCDGTPLVDDDVESASKLDVNVDQDMGKKKKKRRKGSGIDNTTGFFDDL